ncbi:MAG: adenylate/guanylate cyclase domain-containing protein, partial [Candidatus Bipolaricaulota bacterium]
MDHLPRKLAAILYADVADYSRLTGEDEEGTHRLLSAYLDALSQIIEAYGGTVVHYAGDAVLAEFPTVTDALASAAKIQRELGTRNQELPDERKVEFRIGVNLGEIIVDRDDIYGDGVNVAARLESLSEPGGICISEAVRTAVGKKLPLEYEFMGEQQVKNIAEPVRAYHARLRPDAVLPQPQTTSRRSTGSDRRRLVLSVAIGLLIIAGVTTFGYWNVWMPRPEPVSADREAFPLADKPSIAVLPFDNLSGDPEQEYFADGISEDIITELSQLSNLLVIARNSSFTYKDRTVKAQDVGKELGVSYVLEGSVRKSSDRVRITAQLIDAGNGFHLWAERYDRTLAEVFAVQDDVTRKIVSALSVKLAVQEEEQLARGSTGNFEAYDLLLRGQQYERRRTKEDNALARDTYRRAIELDPRFARAYGAVAISLVFDYRRGWTDSPGQVLDRALELAQKAVTLDRSSPQVYWALGYVYLYKKRYEEALMALEHAVTLAPNYADGYGLLAFINNYLGRSEEAIRLIQKGMQLNPYYTFEYPYNLGLAYYWSGRYSEAVKPLQEAIERNESALMPHLFLAASFIRLGQQDDA